MVESTLFCAHGFTGQAWVRDLRLTIDADGRIQSLKMGQAPQRGDVILQHQALMPAACNLHSHTFQRAMAGRTERTESKSEGDSFWTWRTMMYRFLDHLGLEQVEAIAALAQMEMMEAGFAAVAEFHYLHHQTDGSAYDNPAEISHRVMSAAEETGIGLTHLPVLYSYGGAGNQPLSGGQRRFGHKIDTFTTLIESLRSDMNRVPKDWNLGAAPHSLRATDPEQLHILKSFMGDAPIHIHIAEQQKEVEAVTEWLGARPVEYLMGNIGIDKNWCLVHATHMTASETDNLARSGAVAGLCPITEANLGDGIFPGTSFQRAGGTYGVGTDSNTGITLNGELRLLEYGQRLRDQSRNAMLPPDSIHGSTGQTLYEDILRGSAKALSRTSGQLAEGQWADLLTLDLSQPAMTGLTADQMIDGWIFGTSTNGIHSVWSAGRQMVEAGRHIKRDQIIAGYRDAITSLFRVL